MGQASKQCRVTVTPMVSLEIPKFTSAKETAHLHFPCYKYQACFLQPALSQQNSIFQAGVFTQRSCSWGCFPVRGCLGKEGEINYGVNKAPGTELHSQRSSVKRKLCKVKLLLCLGETLPAQSF